MGLIKELFSRAINTEDGVHVDVGLPEDQPQMQGDQQMGQAGGAQGIKTPNAPPSAPTKTPPDAQPKDVKPDEQPVEPSKHVDQPKVNEFSPDKLKKLAEKNPDLMRRLQGGGDEH